jgi:hypothetical protein
MKLSLKAVFIFFCFLFIQAQGSAQTQKILKIEHIQQTTLKSSLSHKKFSLEEKENFEMELQTRSCAHACIRMSTEFQKTLSPKRTSYYIDENVYFHLLNNEAAGMTTKQIVNALEKHLGRRIKTEAFISYAEIKEQINLNRPVHISIAWLDNQGSHSMLISGYIDHHKGTEKVLVIHDPIRASSITVPYLILLSGYYDCKTPEENFYTEDGLELVSEWYRSFIITDETFGYYDISPKRKVLRSIDNLPKNIYSYTEAEASSKEN